MTRKSTHELKILAGFNPTELEAQFKDYADSVQERFGDAFNLSHWVELAQHEEDGFPKPLIYIFIYVEEYMSDEEYYKKYPELKDLKKPL